MSTKKKIMPSKNICLWDFLELQLSQIKIICNLEGEWDLHWATNPNRWYAIVHNLHSSRQSVYF
jgi:hypothetical protein